MRDAEAYHTRAMNEVRDGIHTPVSKSATIAEADQMWLQSSENATWNARP